MQDRCMLARGRSAPGPGAGRNRSRRVRRRTPMKAKSVIGALATVAMLAFAAGCGSDDDGSTASGGGGGGGGGLPKVEKKDTYKVGFAQTESNNPWRLAQTASMKEEAEKKGWQLV